MARKLPEDVAVRTLRANNYPAHRTIHEFRQLHLEEFSALFVQVVKLARKGGSGEPGSGGRGRNEDQGEREQAQAMSFARMQEEEARLKREFSGLLEQAEAQDAADEDRYGSDDHNGGLPQE
jgi:hypothetical protein